MLVAVDLAVDLAVAVAVAVAVDCVSSNPVPLVDCAGLLVASSCSHSRSHFLSSSVVTVLVLVVAKDS